MAKTNENNNGEPLIISKMSVKSIGCTPAGVAEPGKRLCVIFGNATGLKKGEDKVRDSVWVALTGNFEAYRFPQDGEPAPARYQSGKLFLPAGIHDTIESAVQMILDGGAETMGQSVKFGLELRSVKSGNPSGYSYQAITVLPIEQTDELTELRKAIMGAGKTSMPSLELAAPEVQRITAGDVGQMPAAVIEPAKAPARRR
jgi:hypothetical protein